MTGWAHKHRPWRKALRSFRHAAEALLQALLMGFFWLLPVDWASGLGGWLTRQIGTRLSTSRRALKHLAIAFPDMPEAERRAELMPIVAYNHGLNLTVVSRPVNNPFIQRILLYFREKPTGNW